MSIFIGIFFRGCFYDNAYDNLIFTLSFSRGRKRRSYKRCPNGNVLILALITPLRTPIFNFRVLLRSPVKTSLDIEQLQCQEQCIDRTPYYPSGL